MKQRKFLTFVLVIAALAAIFAVSAFAEVKNGTLNQTAGITYTYDTSTKLLTISAPASVTSLTYDSGVTLKSVAADAKEVYVDMPGLTTTLDQSSAFAELEQMVKISIPKTLTILGNMAFFKARRLTTVNVIGDDDYNAENTLNFRHVTRLSEYCFNGAFAYATGDIRFICAEANTLGTYKFFTGFGNANYSGEMTFVVKEGTPAASYVSGVINGTGAVDIGLSKLKLEIVVGEEEEEALYLNKSKGITYTYDTNTKLLTISAPASITSLTYDSGVTLKSVAADAKEVYVDMPGLTTTLEQDKAFAELEQMVKISIPKTLTILGNNAFFKARRLTTVNVIGDDYYNADGTLNFRHITRLNEYSFDGAFAFATGNVRFLCAAGSLGTYTFLSRGFGNNGYAGEMTFVIAENSPAANIIIPIIDGTASYSPGIALTKLKYETYALEAEVLHSGTLNAEDEITYKHDANGVLTISAPAGVKEISYDFNTDQNGANLPWITGGWANAVTSVIIEGEDVENISEFYALCRLEKVTSVELPAGLKGLSFAIFYCNRALNTVYYSDNEKVSGVIDLSRIESYENVGYVFEGAFRDVKSDLTIMISEDCGILSLCTGIGHNSYTGTVTFKVYKNGAEDKFLSGILAGTIEKPNGYKIANLVISYYDSYFNDCIAPVGVSVRMNSYNGLRYIYSVENDKLIMMEAYGYTLKEVGLVLSSGANKDNTDLALSGEEYVTSAENIIKCPVIKNGAVVGKILSSSDENSTLFAGTIKNFTEENYRTDIYVRAYSVFEDKEGNETVRYCDYGDVSEEYQCANLFETTVDMYMDNADEIRSSEEVDSVMWEVLSWGASQKDITFADGLTALTIDYNNENSSCSCAVQTEQFLQRKMSSQHRQPIQMPQLFPWL